jgi:hypothetical protein
MRVSSRNMKVRLYLYILKQYQRQIVSVCPHKLKN